MTVNPRATTATSAHARAAQVARAVMVRVVRAAQVATAQAAQVARAVMVRAVRAAQVGVMIRTGMIKKSLPTPRRNRTRKTP
jgi:hypothetical protein